MRKFLFDDTGTGKTKRSIDIMVKTCNSILVVCPAAVCPTWVIQVARWGEGCKSVILDGKEKSADYASVMFRSTTNRPFFAIVSYDSMLRAWPLVARFPKDVHWGVIFDESHYLKNQRSQRSQKSRKLSERADELLMLTATPTPKDVEDIYSQCKTMYPNTDERCEQFGDEFKTLGSFRQTFGTPHVKYINGRGITEYSYSDMNVKRVSGIVQKFTLPVRVSAMKALTPLLCPCPEPSTKEVEVFDKWMDEWTFEGDVQVDAKTASERALKKNQLDDGFIYDDDGNEHWFGSSKIDGVWDKALELSKMTGLPTVIWTRFKAPFNLLSQRDEAVPAMVLLSQPWHNQVTWRRRYKVIVAQQQASGTGVDGLQKMACMQIWLDLPFTNAEFYQANSRLNRRGQKHEVRVYIADTPINHAIYDVIQGRKKLDDIMRNKQSK